jgi:hypothetical protein
LIPGWICRTRRYSSAADSGLPLRVASPTKAAPPHRRFCLNAESFDPFNKLFLLKAQASSSLSASGWSGSRARALRVEARLPLPGPAAPGQPPD